jgi:hypothetical protein
MKSPINLDQWICKWLGDASHEGVSREYKFRIELKGGGIAIYYCRHPCRLYTFTYEEVLAPDQNPSNNEYQRKRPTFEEKLVLWMHLSFPHRCFYQLYQLSVSVKSIFFHPVRSIPVVTCGAISNHLTR